MSKHTSGPWTAPNPRSDYEGRVFDRSIMAATNNGNPIPIARAYNNIGTNCEANARLIAAAPDLLAALGAMIDNEPCRIDHHGNCQTHRLGNPCEMVAARAAIAKARGE